MAVVKKTQNTFTGGVLSPNVAARVDLQKYASGCARIVNGVVHVHGGISNRPGTEYVDTLPGDGVLIPFVYSVEQTYALAFFDGGDGTARMRIYSDGGVVIDASGDAVEIGTPYLASDIPRIKFAQSADTMFLVHPSYRPYRLTRSGHTNWAFSEMKFAPSIAAPTNLKTSPTGFKDETNTYYETTISYKVSAVSAREVESVPSSSASATILSTWPSGAKVSLTWDKVTGAVRYEVYKNARGWYEWIGSAESNSFTDDYIEGDDMTGPKESRDPFVGEGNYPGAVGIYQQRLIFGRTNNEPQTVWLSETGSFDSMAVAQPLRDDSAITATIDSKQMNEIRHFIPLRDMLMLTSGAEFKMGAQGGAITPASILFDIQSYWGSSEVPPIVSGTSIVMVQNSGRAVRDLHYQLSEDGYAGSEVSILAGHLLNSPIRDWAYQQSPYSTIWICLESGRLLTFTYMRDQEVWAWAEHESSGARFRSATCVREGTEDSVYFLVKRDGKYYIEHQVRRDYGDDAKLSHFVDCGLRYADAANPIRHVTGLDHLAGKEVVALADGSVVRGLTVAPDGSVDLPFHASYISAGLPYQMLVETLDQSIRMDDGDTAGERKNVVKIVLRLQETRGLEAGPDEAHLTVLKQQAPAVYGAPPPLVTGEVSVVLTGTHRTSTSIVLVQKDPLPATVLALTSWISVG